MVVNVDWNNVSDKTINELVNDIVESTDKPVDWCNDWKRTLELCQEYQISLEFKAGVSVYPIAYHGPTPVLGTYHIDKNILRAACIVLIKINNQ
jgi:hypothetical protein